MRCEKAQLEVLDKSGKTTATIPVQFNPTTMQLQMANSIDGTKNKGRQTRKYSGTSSTTLSLDLEFDTADHGTKEEPADVRALTADVVQFVLPGGEKSKQAPPRVRFCWGTFALTGIMSSLSEELSFFSPEGVPLRAKVSVQIKEQDPAYAALEAGPGANPNGKPPPAGKDPDEAKPGGNGDGAKDKAAETQDNETPADFLARNGLAPEAWRALGGALDALSDGVGFDPGIAIPFPSSISLGGSLGVSAGFQAGLDLSIGASLGLDATVGSMGAPKGAGFALAAAGGVTAAAQTATQAASDSASADARSSFGVPTSPAAASAGSSRSPVATSTTARTLSNRASAPAPLPTRADARSASFGRGVPLRDQTRTPGAPDDGYVVIGRPSTIAVTETTGRRRGAPWDHLPPSSSRTRADDEQHRRSPSCGCHRCDPRSTQRFGK